MRITSSTLLEYMEIGLEMKRLEARQKEIREALIEQSHPGLDGFTVSITQSTVRRVAGLEKIYDKSPKLVEALERAGLVTESAQTRVSVKPA